VAAPGKHSARAWAGNRLGRGVVRDSDGPDQAGVFGVGAQCVLVLGGG
jgi:hypothetical protein